MKVHTIRQGDVLLLAVTNIPKDAKDVTPAGDVILAYGEQTGHAHRIVQTKDTPKVRVWDAGAERYLQVIVDGAQVTHEEHTAVTLDAPIFRQVYQVEERGEEVRRVAD